MEGPDRLVGRVPTLHRTTPVRTSTLATPQCRPSMHPPLSLVKDIGELLIGHRHWDRGSPCPKSLEI